MADVPIIAKGLGDSRGRVSENPPPGRSRCTCTLCKPLAASCGGQWGIIQTRCGCVDYRRVELQRIREHRAAVGLQLLVASVLQRCGVVTGTVGA
jgi:hypothetical protein